MVSTANKKEMDMKKHRDGIKNSKIIMELVKTPDRSAEYNQRSF